MRVQKGLETSPWSRSCPCLGCFPTPPPGTAFHLNERLKSGEKIVEGFTWLAENSSLWPAMNWAHFLINLIASMLVSGKAALHANSERHLIASWKINWISLNVGATKQYLERVYHGCELGFKHLCDNFTRCLGNKELVWIGLDWLAGTGVATTLRIVHRPSKVFTFFQMRHLLFKKIVVHCDKSFETWKASSTIFSSWSAAAMWKTEKIFVQPDLMLCPWDDKDQNWISNYQIFLIYWIQIYFHLHVHHVGNASDHHVSDCTTLVVLHDVLKRPNLHKNYH